eukprot:240715-Amphidinium_carterae.1
MGYFHLSWTQVISQSVRKHKPITSLAFEPLSSCFLRPFGCRNASPSVVYSADLPGSMPRGQCPEHETSSSSSKKLQGECAGGC